MIFRMNTHQAPGNSDTVENVERKKVRNEKLILIKGVEHAKHRPYALLPFHYQLKWHSN